MPPVCSTLQIHPDGFPGAIAQPRVETPVGRPKMIFGPQDSHMNVYSDGVELERLGEPGAPALPVDAQLLSASTTLNRAMILRNRIGPGGGPPPMPTKSPHMSAGPMSSTSMDTSGSSRQLLAPHPTPPNDAEVPASAFAVCSSSPSVANKVLNLSMLDAAGGLLLHSGSINPASFFNKCQSSTVGGDCCGSSSMSTRSGTQGSVMSVFTSGASGSGGVNQALAPVYGLGVEATLNEMQQMALIGSGGGGCVYIGRWRGVTVAMKFIVSSNDDQLILSQREALLSRLASHPHVVQTYATSVTRLTESMLAAKEGAPGDAHRAGMSCADVNISHDALAGLINGSWIRGELPAAIHRGVATTNNAPNGGSLMLPTIPEISPSSGAGSATASASTSSRGGGNALGGAATAAYESDGQMSSSSTILARSAKGVVEGAGALARSGAAGGQIDMATGSSPSCLNSTNSSIGFGPQPRLMAVLNSASGLHGTPSGSTPTSESGVELHMDTAGGCAPVEAVAAGAEAAAAITAPTGEAAGSGLVATTTPAAMGTHLAYSGRKVAGGGTLGGAADSFDSSYVRDHLVRAKYAMHEVLWQLGAREGQFLTMVVMEYCDGGSLLAALKEGPFHRDTTSWSPRMLLRSTVRTAMEIAHGMQHLHLSGLLHGDLKPGNVLLKGSNQDKRKFIAKVSDLGLAHPVGAADEMAIDDGQIGSIAYMAPEVFHGRMMKASDVYSFGVLLWQLVCGTGASPFGGAHPVAIALGVSEGTMTLHWPPGVFRPLQQLGELCLQADPAARPSFKSVVGALEKLERHMQRLTTVSGYGIAVGTTSGSGNVGSAGCNVTSTSPASSITAPMQ